MPDALPLKVCGVISEYNPFHKGHEYQLKKAREATGAQVVVCVMSGPFTQRGDAAILSPGVRAEMALRCGADVVVELPAAYAIREAEFFALGGVSILQALGVDFISFGCESGDVTPLWEAARLLEDPTVKFTTKLHEGLRVGRSHARAQGEALAACQNGRDAKIISSPNNVLAICYLRALLRLRCDITPIPVLRLGAYHDSAWQEGFASATAVRGALLRGDWATAERMIPEAVFSLLAEAFAAGLVHRPQALDLLLRDRLRSFTSASLVQYPNVGEGLEHRLQRLQAEYTSRESLLSALKTKRYTHARLNRLLTHILLDMTKDRLAACQPQSFRLLAFQDSARPYLSSLPPGLLYTKPARKAKDASFLLDMAAYDLWAMGAGLPLGQGYRQQVVRGRADDGDNNGVSGF